MVLMRRPDWWPHPQDPEGYEQYRRAYERAHLAPNPDKEKDRGSALLLMHDFLMAATCP